MYVADSLTIPSGATLSGIAEKEGTTVAEIMKLNPGMILDSLGYESIFLLTGIKDPNDIKAGSKLILPAKSKPSDDKVFFFSFKANYYNRFIHQLN